MATLRFDDDSGEYVGPTLRIDEVTFLDALQRGILDGEPPEQALARLTLEESWREPALGSDKRERSAKSVGGRSGGWEGVCVTRRRGAGRSPSRH